MPSIANSPSDDSAPSTQHVDVLIVSPPVSPCPSTVVRVDRPVAIKAVSLAAVPKGETSIVIDAHLNDVQSLHHLTDQSKHVIHMYDFDFQPSTGLCLLILELGREDLDKYLSERAALSPSERRTIWRQLVNIVNTLHRNQMVDRSSR